LAGLDDHLDRAGLMSARPQSCTYARTTHAALTRSRHAAVQPHPRQFQHLPDDEVQENSAGLVHLVRLALLSPSGLGGLLTYAISTSLSTEAAGGGRGHARPIGRPPRVHAALAWMRQRRGTG
jgi:hypothetical protein